MRSAFAAADCALLVERTFGIQPTPVFFAPVHVLAVGKAASPMIDAWLRMAHADVRTATAVAPARPADARRDVEWLEGGHPIPDDRSVRAGERALAVARGVAIDQTFLVLLSGGASALMCRPVRGVTLADIQATSRLLMENGADIQALNCVRRHLSQVKGGWLAAACRGRTLTLAVSDVVDDAPTVIGSGPTVADPSTYADALSSLDRAGGRAVYPAAIRAWLERGAAGDEPETPKPGDPRLTRSIFEVIGSRRDALGGARDAAQARGYDVHVVCEPVIGEARTAARAQLPAVVARSATMRKPCCIISAGETTVHVTGRGRGGRNQEFALALAEALAALDTPIAVASVGTDGVDGPTDAAGAIVDSTTVARARAAGLAPPARYLEDNNAYPFFDRLGDLVRTGPTGTNVGDLQLYVIGT